MAVTSPLARGMGKTQNRNSAPYLVYKIHVNEFIRKQPFSSMSGRNLMDDNSNQNFNLSNIIIMKLNIESEFHLFDVIIVIDLYK